MARGASGSHEQRTDDPGAPASTAEQDHGRLGAFLCWAVVFADIGTSVYYTPGILYGQAGVGTHAALFVALTLLVFVLLTRKYAEVAVRYPEGGGVVTVAAHALHPFAGLVGGMFILVDYFLTAALSALSGIIYLSAVVPLLGPLVLPVTLGALVLLALLNLVGVSASAKVNATFAVIAALSQVAVVVAVIVRVGPGQLIADLPRVLSGPHLTPLTLLTGYAGAFLAFSGLESISQLSPVMAEPRRRVTRLAMGALVATIGLTSPLLTLWSTTVLPSTKHSDPNQFISLLGGYAAGRALEVEVAVSGALLLVFASNTALIGSYHVFLALCKLGFLPRVLERRNRWRDTPHWAILVAAGIPLAVLVASQGSVSVLGDLYAFGLLGAFSLTCLCLDIVRWHERHPAARGPHGSGHQTADPAPPDVGHIGRVAFGLGILATVLVSLAWITNLIAKPMATLFGGGVTVVGLVIAGLTYALGRRAGRPFVFPLLHHPEYPVLFLARGRRARPPATVLAVLPTRTAQIGPLVQSANVAAAGGPIVFVQRGSAVAPHRSPRMLEVVTPYHDDPAAQAAFAQAEKLARREGLNHRYLYLPTTAAPDAVARFAATLQPRETVVVADDAALLAALPGARARRTVEGGTPILHYTTQG